METSKCPVSGLPVSNPQYFAGQQPGSNFTMALATLGDRIILIKTTGYMRSEDEDEFLTFFDAYQKTYFQGKNDLFVIEDFAEIEGADAEARKKYVAYFKNSPFLLGGIIYQLSPLFRISFNLARRFQVYKKNCMLRTPMPTRLRGL